MKLFTIKYLAFASIINNNISKLLPLALFNQQPSYNLAPAGSEEQIKQLYVSIRGVRYPPAVYCIHQGFTVSMRGVLYPQGCIVSTRGVLYVPGVCCIHQECTVSTRGVLYPPGVYCIYQG